MVRILRSSTDLGKCLSASALLLYICTGAAGKSISLVKCPPLCMEWYYSQKRLIWSRTGTTWKSMLMYLRQERFKTQRNKILHATATLGSARALMAIAFAGPLDGFCLREFGKASLYYQNVPTVLESKPKVHKTSLIKVTHWVNKIIV